MTAPTLFATPLLPATGDSLKPLIVALAIFIVAVVAIIFYMILRRNKDK